MQHANRMLSKFSFVYWEYLGLIPRCEASFSAESMYASHICCIKIASIHWANSKLRRMINSMKSLSVLNFMAL